MPSGDPWTVDEERDLVNLCRESWRASGHHKAVEAIARKLDRSPAAISSRLERLSVWIDGHQLIQEPGTSSFECLSCGDWYGLDTDDGWNQRRSLRSELAAIRRGQEQILAALRRAFDLANNYGPR